MKNLLAKYHIDFSLSDSNQLKAICILLIIAHNYFHCLEPLIGENEMVFGQYNFSNFLSALQQTPYDLFRPFFSFFGHYGVHIFIFLSGYGLTKKCLNREITEFASLYRVSLGQIFKLVKLTLVGFVFLLLFQWVVWGDSNWLGYLKGYGEFLTFSQNLRPDRIFSLVSVWWFLCLIVQFYLVFPLLFRLATESQRAFIVLSVLAIFASIILYKPLLAQKIYVYATPLGHLAVFALGMHFALGRGIPRWAIVGALVIFPFSLIYEAFFHLSFVSVVLLSIALYDRYKERIQNVSILHFIGGLSMFLYIVHGDMRKPFLHWLSQMSHAGVAESYWIFVAFVISVFIAALACQKISAALGLFGKGKGKS